MKLSIITINYNNKSGLEKTIESVMSQNWRDFEWIIIDGGSTDGSKDVIEALANNPEAKISYWCSEKDKGIYNALNKGIKFCKGSYICCMNSGDVFYDDFILQYVFNKEYSSDILYGDWVRVESEKEEIIKAPSNFGIYELYKNNICHQAMFVKTQLLKREGFDETYILWADYKRWVVAALDGAQFEYIDKIVCKFDTSGLSNTRLNLVEAEHNRLVSEYPPMVMHSIKKIEKLEYQDFLILNNRYVKRTLQIIEKGGLSSFILRILLKIFTY